MLNINKETTSFPAAGIRTAVKNTSKCDVAKWCVVLNVNKETTSFPAAVTTKKTTRLRESFPLERVNFFFTLHQTSSHKYFQRDQKYFFSDREDLFDTHRRFFSLSFESTQKF